MRQAADNRERDVAGDRLRHDEALAVTVFGQVGEAKLEHLLGAGWGDALTIEEDVSFAWRRHADTRLGDLRASWAHQARHADDLPGTQREGDVGEDTRKAKLLDAERFPSAAMLLSSGEQRLDRPADHHANDCGPI